MYDDVSKRKMDLSSISLKAMTDRKKDGKMEIQKFECLENGKSF